MSTVARLLGDVVGRLLFTPASVGEITEHEGFRTIELVGERLVGGGWVPGDKLRVHIDGTALRTYTPMCWDRDLGRTQLLAYLPGDGPGSEWCAHARTGDACSLFGPQRSVRLDQLDAAPIIVGDETSFGLFVAWRNHRPELSPAAAIFEVTGRGPAAAVLDELGAPPADLVERTTDGGHLPAVEDLVVAALRASSAAPLVLTGCAQTIAAVRRRVKAEGLSGRDTSVKAYWDVNRKGLD